MWTPVVVPPHMRALTHRAEALLAEIEADDGELLSTVPADCDHPYDEREQIDPAYGIEFCAACRTELVEGRAAA